MPVDQQVVGDVRPSPRLMVCLECAQLRWRLPVVAQDDGAVVDGDVADLMADKGAGRRTGLPGGFSE
jgi:hypothetical protein